MSSILQTFDLKKNYYDKEVVSNVNLSVREGEIYGLLGPNGAGKTTILKMITNLVQPTSGEVWIFGEQMTDSSCSIFQKMGIQIEYPIFYEHLTARKNLELHCAYTNFHDERRMVDVLEQMGLEKAIDIPVKEFSLGMKQRLGIARAILANPDLLIMDEPLNGLDPEGIHYFRNLLQKLKKEHGMTIILSSHILSEIELIADTVALIHEGRLLEEVSLQNLRLEQEEYIEIQTPQIKKVHKIIQSEFNGLKTRMNPVENCIFIYNTDVPVNQLLQMLINQNVKIDGFQKKYLTLEQYFLERMNGRIRNA